MSACTCCQQPESHLAILIESKTGAGGYFSTPAAAWADAVGAIPAFANVFTPSILAEGTTLFTLANGYTTGGPPFTSEIERSQFKWAVVTPSCYFKVWFDKVERNIYAFSPANTGTEISRTSGSYTWTPISVGGICLPADFNFSDGLTWPASGVFGPEEPNEPPTPVPYGVVSRFVNLEKVRWSFLPSYTPPEDGSANGFPL